MLAVGAALVLLALLLLVVGLVKGIYTLALSPSNAASAKLASAVLRSIHWLYAEVAAHALSLTAWLWSSAAPALDLRKSIWAVEHRALWVLYALLFAGSALVRRARARLAQIAAFQEWAARIQLEEQIRLQVRRGSSALPKAQITPRAVPPLKFQWHTTWWGVLALTVGAGLLTDVFKVVLGLAKLP